MSEETKPVFDAQLLSYCTVGQLEKLEAVNKHGGVMAAARALGIHHSTLQEAIDRVKRKASIAGYSPEHDMVHPVPATHIAKGVSTYYDKEGKPAGQWVKSSLDHEQYLRVIREVVADVMEGLPRHEPTRAPQFTHDCLCNLYTMTDCHVGMLAWAPETGASWDLKIAEATLSGCFEHMVNSSPPAKVAFVSQLGDFLHIDGGSGMVPVTPLHGHVLDADGRFSKMVQAAIRILRRMIGYALQRHEKVIVLMAEGNHDMASSVWLRALFKALYENEPRVQVVDSEMPYYVYQHGKTMLCFHHGHLSKNAQLPILFAAQFPKIWGETSRRYAHTGHRHHVEEKEHSGITVTQHPTLAARDAYAARGGWIAARQVTSYTYHSEFGKVASNTICPEMLE